MLQEAPNNVALLDRPAAPAAAKPSSSWRRAERTTVVPDSLRSHLQLAYDMLPPQQRSQICQHPHEVKLLISDIVRKASRAPTLTQMTRENLFLAQIRLLHMARARRVSSKFNPHDSRDNHDIEVAETYCDLFRLITGKLPPPKSVAGALLHEWQEDYDGNVAELRSFCKHMPGWGEEIAATVTAMTIPSKKDLAKIYPDAAKDPLEMKSRYKMANLPITMRIALAKGADGWVVMRNFINDLDRDRILVTNEAGLVHSKFRIYAAGGERRNLLERVRYGEALLKQMRLIGHDTESLSNDRKERERLIARINPDRVPSDCAILIYATMLELVANGWNRAIDASLARHGEKPHAPHPAIVVRLPQLVAAL